MDREESKSSLSLCRDPRLIVYFAYANEFTSLQCHVTSCETSFPLCFSHRQQLTGGFVQISFLKIVPKL